MGEDMESPLQGQVINPLQGKGGGFEAVWRVSGDSVLINLAKISLTKEKVVSLYEYYHTFLQKRENCRVMFCSRVL